MYVRHSFIECLSYIEIREAGAGQGSLVLALFSSLDLLPNALLGLAP